MYSSMKSAILITLVLSVGLTSAYPTGRDRFYNKINRSGDFNDMDVKSPYRPYDVSPYDIESSYNVPNHYPYNSHVSDYYYGNNQDYNNKKIISDVVPMNVPEAGFPFSEQQLLEMNASIHPQIIEQVHRHMDVDDALDQDLEGHLEGFTHSCKVCIKKGSYFIVERAYNKMMQRCDYPNSPEMVDFCTVARKYKETIVGYIMGVNSPMPIAEAYCLGKRMCSGTMEVLRSKDELFKDYLEIGSVVVNKNSEKNDIKDYEEGYKQYENDIDEVYAKKYGINNYYGNKLKESRYTSTDQFQLMHSVAMQSKINHEINYIVEQLERDGVLNVSSTERMFHQTFKTFATDICMKQGSNHEEYPLEKIAFQKTLTLENLKLGGDIANTSCMCSGCVGAASAAIMKQIFVGMIQYCYTNKDLETVQRTCHMAIQEPGITFGLLYAQVQPQKFAKGFCSGRQDCTLREVLIRPMVHGIKKQVTLNKEIVV